MKDSLQIKNAACDALKRLGRPGIISEIYKVIVDAQLFEFDTPTPEHVLRTTIRRHTGNVDRIDSSGEVLFQMYADEVYGLVGTDRKVSRAMATTTGIKRVHRAVDKDEIIKLLTGEQLGVFREIWRLLMFAAQIGYRNGRRDALKAIDSGKGIDQSTFGNSPSWPGVVYLLCLAEHGSAEVLGGTAVAEESRIAAFQEYANGGLAILANFFAARPVDLDGLIAFIDNQRGVRSAAPDLELAI